MNTRKIQLNYWENQKDRRSPTHEVIENFARPKVDFTLKNTALDNNAKVLDVGCGNGYFTYYFNQKVKTIGLDFSMNMLKANPCKNLILANANALPFKDNSFDIVFEANLLHHLDDPKKTVMEMKRVSLNYVIFLEPNNFNPLNLLFSLINSAEKKVLKFSRKYMQNMVTDAQLKLIELSTFGTIVPNKTPSILVKLLSKFDLLKNPFGFYNFIISKKVK